MEENKNFQNDSKAPNRRSFLQMTGLGAGVVLGGSELVNTNVQINQGTSAQGKANTREKIRDVRVLMVSPKAKENEKQYFSEKAWTVTNLIASPMSIYPEYHDSRQSWGVDILGGIIVEIEDTAGNIGIGVSSGGIPGAFLIEKHFKRFLMNQYPHDIEKIWDQMWRGSMHYGRKGLAIMAISAVDLALWDLLGKQRQEPVYAMIGGQVKSEIPLYATTINVKYAKDMGFWGAKMPLPHGPGDGRPGSKDNVRIMEEARNAIGDDFDLMYDCWMALDVPYTIELAKALEPIRIKWLEEFLPPDDYDGLIDVRAAVKSCWLTTGEHEYTRYGFLEILKRRSINILQPDVSWCGGFSEALKIAKMAEAYKVMVVPHVSSSYSYHLVIAQTNSPFSEFIILGPRGDKIVPVFGNLFEDEPLPVDGKMKLTDKPGFGLTLNRKGLEFTRPFPS